ncbi:ornithine cyclodeaminase [Exiguobacterium sp. SH3S1]|uniref:ornithine cyclodeaminase n=1 Tax=Exiguobacterium sp. SH3S1 TaxID=2510955 RepID=UPI00103B58C0|nr:ornithine cyclodeaminase [Exiguobacterium sp. SH3S1]TCI66405.1 ornithine cyclodeaminase [Exiguobacterium sp. SH3S1]
MGFFKSIKNLFVSSTEVLATKKVKIRMIANNKYYKSVDEHLFKKEHSLDLVTETDASWSSFFSVNKVDPKLIGFNKRSKKKYRLLFKTEEQIIAYAAYTIEIVNKEGIKRIIYKDTPLEKMSIVDANNRNVILRDKNKIAHINLETAQASIYNFSWQPFSSAVGDNYWLIGTRQTYEGPGELYMFGADGELKWAINFIEPPMQTMFRAVHVTAYHLKVSSDYSDIFVSSMDRLYRITPDGELKARIAISELKEGELRSKHEETQKSLSTPPKDRDEAIGRIASELAESFMSNMKRLTFNSPFTGFAHDPSTDMIFILESEGRVTGWDSSGELVWTYTFKEKGRFISWLDEKLILSFETGEIFWLNRDGYYEYSAKLPKEAWTISNIPNLSKYLIVCKDNRLYELDKLSGDLLVGTTGHPGMELFTSSKHLIFFDGEHDRAGYLWLSPINQQWTIFEKIEVNDNENENHQLLNGIAPEIKETVPFKEIWSLQRADENEAFGTRIVDFKNRRIFVSERPDFDVRKVYENVKDEKERQKIFDAQDLVCYDFQQNKLWSKRFYNYLFSVFLSPDSEQLFIGVPLKDNVSYEPGYIVLLNKDGGNEGEIKAPAHGFHIDFQSHEEAIITFSTERGEDSRIYRLYKVRTGKWELGEQLDKNQVQNDFGAGLNDIDINNFSLRRIDKKKYICRCGESELELKLNAAIYEAYTTDQENLLIRVGNKTLIRYDSNLNKLWVVKTESAAIKTVIGSETLIVVSKEDITSYGLDNGQTNWRISAPPKSVLNDIFWLENLNKYVWFSGNNQEFYVASLNEQGSILNSQLFSDLLLYNQTRFDEEQNLLIIQKSNLIEGYRID